MFFPSLCYLNKYLLPIIQLMHWKIVKVLCCIQSCWLLLLGLIIILTIKHHLGRSALTIKFHITLNLIPILMEFISSLCIIVVLISWCWFQTYLFLSKVVLSEVFLFSFSQNVFARVPLLPNPEKWSAKTLFFS